MSMRNNLNVLEKIKKNSKLFLFQLKKGITKIDEDGNESVFNMFTKQNLLIVKDLWQVHYQIV